MTQQWKPITSAPKDGTEVVVFHPDAGVCAAFCPGDGFAWHCMDGMNTVVGSKSGKSIPVMTSFLKPPTHWMPLPAAPGTPPASAQDDAKDDDEPLPYIVQRVLEFAGEHQDNCTPPYFSAQQAIDLAEWIQANRRPAPAAGDAQDDQTRWTLRWIMREADAAKETCSTDPESPAAIRNAKLAAIATAAAQALGLVRGPSYADPGADDAKDAARWRWVFSHAENVGFDYKSGRFTTLTIAGRQRESLVAFVDAAIAASQQQEG